MSESAADAETVTGEAGTGVERPAQTVGTEVVAVVEIQTEGVGGAEAVDVVGVATEGGVAAGGKEKEDTEPDSTNMEILEIMFGLFKWAVRTEMEMEKLMRINR